MPWLRWILGCVGIGGCAFVLRGIALPTLESSWRQGDIPKSGTIVPRKGIMKAILFVVLLNNGAPVDTLAAPFRSMKDCEDGKAQVLQTVLQNPLIRQFVAVCGEVQEKV